MHTNHVARGILHAILNRQHVARSPQHSERTLLHAGEFLKERNFKYEKVSKNILQNLLSPEN